MTSMYSQQDKCNAGDEMLFASAWPGLQSSCNCIDYLYREALQGLYDKQKITQSQLDMDFNAAATSIELELNLLHRKFPDVFSSLNSVPYIDLGKPCESVGL